MIEALRVVAKTFRDLWDEMFNLVLMNLVTLVLIVLIVPGPPAWLALHAVAHRIANDYAIRWEHYFSAFRQHFAKAWLYALASGTAIALIVLNFWWYGAAFGGQFWVQWVRGAWLAAALFWVVINFYIVPLYIEQTEKRWRIALRNALVVAGANPLFTLTLLAVGGLLMGVSLVFTPLFVFLGLSLWVLLSTEAVVNRVNAWRRRMGLVVDEETPSAEA